MAPQGRGLTSWIIRAALVSSAALPWLVSAQCSHHGRLGVSDAAQGCECFTGWRAPDCSQRTCPSAVAFVGKASGDGNDAHEAAECSNAGVCDRTVGSCVCTPGFTGAACQQSE